VYIRFKGKEHSSNRLISNEGFILASDAAFWRDDVSLLQVISGDFLFSASEVNELPSRALRCIPEDSTHHNRIMFSPVDLQG
jgi:hypothetical protein